LNDSSSNGKKQKPEEDVDVEAAAKTNLVCKTEIKLCVLLLFVFLVK
jgi:hypothetical protein